MHQKVLLRGITILLLLVLSVAYGNEETSTADTNTDQQLCTGQNCGAQTTGETISEAANPTTTAEKTTLAPATEEKTTLAPATTMKATTQAQGTTFQPTTKKSKTKKRRTTKKPSRRDSDEESSDSSDDQDTDLLDSLDIWVAYADGWNFGDKSKYSGRGKGNYRKPAPKKQPRKKQSQFSPLRIPVRHYSDFRQFPLNKFSPLISILPWLPIFYDRNTYQTIIFSPSGGLYVLPPLINFYGQRFSVAQLIKWGYASLVSTGAPPQANVDIASFVQPPSALPVVNAPNMHVATGVTFNENQGRFADGVHTNLPDIRPQYSHTFYEEGHYNN